MPVLTTSHGISVVTSTIRQLTSGGRSDTGRTVLAVILLLLLIGGIFLVVHGVMDFLRDRRRSRRAQQSDKRKAA